jgi:hypothetical protein
MEAARLRHLGRPAAKAQRLHRGSGFPRRLPLAFAMRGENDRELV